MENAFKPCKTLAELKAVPFFSQFTEDQLLRQVRKSLEGIESMKARLLASGKNKINGFTQSDLDGFIQNYKSILS